MATNKRIPKQNITHSAPIIYAAGSIDEVFLANSPDAIGSEEEGFNYGGAGSFRASASLSGALPFAPEDPNAPEVPILPEIQYPDVPSLSDIESITYEEYPDPLTGIAKYNAIIKIRNSSRNKSNVSGVDARIYNPSAPTTYTFTATSTASGSSASTIVPKITWYNAKSTCNNFSGTYGSSPTIVGTAQYQSDGKDVPADSTSGPSNARIKSVWRKTSAEALIAAKNSECEL